MRPFRPESSTLPRGFRFHFEDGERPRTPEPHPTTEIPPPPPPNPRQSRLKLKRRNVLEYQFDAPQEDFLASIASADLPVPSIEIVQEEDFSSINFAHNPSSDFLAPAYRTSPPKTPVPQILTSMEEHDSKRPDWSMNAWTPNERPSSALSNPSDYSDETYFSSIRTSRPLDDDSCTSPEDDVMDPFVFPAKGKLPERGPVPVLNGDVCNKSARNAHWSKDQSAHLWHTYQVYLADPTVTPFRVGASSIPPEGVIVRVGREARRSWKGPKKSKTDVCEKLQSPPIDFSFGNIDLSAPLPRSGSNTPTGDACSKAFSQWPHSSAATRNHLRELCKKDSTAPHIHRHRHAKSPMPSGHFRAHSTGHAIRSSSPFSIKEFALSLTTSTSESMRPDGPLAQLATQPRVTPRPFSYDCHNDDLSIGKSSQADLRSRRLGSPFLARSYGPSASKDLESFSRPSPFETLQPGAQHAAPRLGSPVHFEQSKSLNGTYKRRAESSLQDDPFASSGVLRPSILDDQLFGGSLGKRRARSRGFSLGDNAFPSLPPSFSLPQMDGNQPPTPTSAGLQASAPSLLPSATFNDAPAAPQSGAGLSNTFPRRLFQADNPYVDRVRARPYRTMHHPRRSIESFDFGTGPSLQSRLQQLDEKLAEIGAREEAAKRK